LQVHSKKAALNWSALQTSFAFKQIKGEGKRNADQEGYSTGSRDPLGSWSVCVGASNGFARRCSIGRDV
jgi:hypothetical protein